MLIVSDYQVRYVRNSLCTSSLVDSLWTTGSSYTFSGLSHNTRYYYCVRGRRVGLFHRCGRYRPPRRRLRWPRWPNCQLSMYHLHGDHLGSASLATDAADRRYTGQRHEAGLGLYDSPCVASGVKAPFSQDARFFWKNRASVCDQVDNK